MSQIIFLNGCSSAGKTSIAKAIQEISETPWLHLDQKSIIDMMPMTHLPFGTQSEDGLHFVPGDNAYGPTLHATSGEYGTRLFEAIPFVAAALADTMGDLVIDSIVTRQNTWDSYLYQLRHHSVLCVGVICALDVMQAREILRGRNVPGLSNDQFHRIYYGTCALTIDTTHKTPHQAATLILRHLQEHQTTVS